MTRATKCKAWIAVCLGVAMATPVAQAALVMRLSTDDANWTAIGDNLAGVDTNPATGAITFSGTVGTTFTVNVTTGPSNAILVGPAAYMGLSSVNLTTIGPGLLYIELTNTDWAWGDQATAQLVAGGTFTAPVGSSIAFSAWYDPSNNPFALTQSLASIGPFDPGVYADTMTSTALEADAASSLTLRAVIEIMGDNDAALQGQLEEQPHSIPEPGTFALLGIALAGLASSRRRKQ